MFGEYKEVNVNKNEPILVVDKRYLEKFTELYSNISDKKLRYTISDLFSPM